MNRVAGVLVSWRSSRDEPQSPSCKKMTYNLLKEITNNFSDEIGRGAYGVVYKGRDNDGREIAVKRLLNNKDLDGEVFKKELGSLMKLNHPNIVQLLGFCDEDEEVSAEHGGVTVPASEMHRALCLEYVPNGNLRKLLSGEQHEIDWQTRYKIIKGVCQGLKYLQTGLENPVWHLDLKPENILLDNNMVAKIADFGLSRLIPKGITRRTNSNSGTPGYMPPEYINSNVLSRDFDIYCLGVIIMEVMLAPTGISFYYDTYDKNEDKFVEHVLNTWSQRIQKMSAETSLEAQCQQVKTCVKIAVKCLEMERKARPTIEGIVEQLEKTERNMDCSTSALEKTIQSTPPPAFMLEAQHDQTSNLQLMHGSETLPSEHVNNLVPGKWRARFTAAVYNRIALIASNIKARALRPLNGSNGGNQHGIDLASSSSGSRMLTHVLGNWSSRVLYRWIPYESQLLSVEPPELQFRRLLPDQNSPGVLSCSLELTNNTDEYVVFRLIPVPKANCFGRFGYVAPRCSYRHMITWSSEQDEPESGQCFNLESTTAGTAPNMEQLNVRRTKPKSRYDRFFRDARYQGRRVHVVTLKVVVDN